MPSGPIETHGSEARSYVSPPGAHMLNGSACCEPHVTPPSNDAAAINACAPPFDQRPWCQTAIWLAVLAGFTALNGSTSVFGSMVPPAAGAVHPATGLDFAAVASGSSRTNALALSGCT